MVCAFDPSTVVSRDGVFDTILIGKFEDNKVVNRSCKLKKNLQRQKNTKWSSKHYTESNYRAEHI